MRTCTKCCIEKNESEFRIRIDKRVKKPSGLVYFNNTCLLCEAARQREYSKKVRQTPEGRAKHNKWALDFHKRHRQVVLKQMKERRNRPEAKNRRKKYDVENKDRILELGRKRNAKYNKRLREERPDEYAARKLREQLGIPKDIIIKEMPQLVEAKKIIIQIKRKIKHHGNNDNG